jgi:hypothetical protein
MQTGIILDATGYYTTAMCVALRGVYLNEWMGLRSLAVAVRNGGRGHPNCTTIFR